MGNFLKHKILFPLDIVDDKIGRLNGQVDELRPLYNEAKVALGKDLF